MVVLQSAIAGAAVLLLAGLFTPVAGSLLATAEVCLAFSHVKDPSVHVILGALGGGLAMTGPGAWSLDAHFFGRKRIQIPPR
ncbi:MAG: hypothetical protein QOJ99_1048 [Bryobacterales bacterium]|nr:hypothetical protein [Bryobacterales bacterium]